MPGLPFAFTTHIEQLQMVALPLIMQLLHRHLPELCDWQPSLLPCINATLEIATRIFNADPRQAHRLNDSEAGDTLLVVTALGPARGFVKTQDFVDLRALASAHGVAIQPHADDLNAELAADKIVITMFAVLYYAAPNVQQLGFRWVTPCGILAVVVWLVVSGLFGLYVGNFGSYNKTYGSLGAIVIFLVWLWLTNIAILFGAELNAEIARGRQIEAGQPPDREPILPPRARAS